MRPVLCLALAGALVSALGCAMAACHEPEQPPVPPKPTNPTNVRQSVALERTGEVLDASIVSETSLWLDVASFQLEATPVRAAP
jgi:hypothetical protein